jgi:hypothetical protein
MKLARLLVLDPLQNSGPCINLEQPCTSYQPPPLKSNTLLRQRQLNLCPHPSCCYPLLLLLWGPPIHSIAICTRQPRQAGGVARRAAGERPAGACGARDAERAPDAGAPALRAGSRRPEQPAPEAGDAPGHACHPPVSRRPDAAPALGAAASAVTRVAAAAAAAATPCGSCLCCLRCHRRLGGCPVLRVRWVRPPAQVTALWVGGGGGACETGGRK